VYYHLGEAYLLGNQPEESIKQFKHAADLLEHAKLQDVAMKQRVEAGLKKATEQVRAKGEAKLPVDSKSP